jgi:hypothetical protein
VTWNDFGEGTNIEPTQEYGYQYLEHVQGVARGLHALPYAADDLTLPKQLYDLRKQYKGNADVTAQLNQAAAFIVSGQPAQARAILDVTTATLASRIGIDISSDHVLLRWRLGQDGMARVERSASGAGWLELAQTRTDGTGNVTFEDRDIAAGGHYAYRLSVWVDGQWASADEVQVDVPSGPALSLAGLRPNPAVGRDLTIHFALASAKPARLEMLDLAGRRVFGRDVGSLGPGRHAVRLGDGARIAPGVYVLRLVQGQEIRRARAVVFE